MVGVVVVLVVVVVVVVDAVVVQVVVVVVVIVEMVVVMVVVVVVVVVVVAVAVVVVVILPQLYVRVINSSSRRCDKSIESKCIHRQKFKTCACTCTVVVEQLQSGPDLVDDDGYAGRIQGLRSELDNTIRLTGTVIVFRFLGVIEDRLG